MIYFVRHGRKEKSESYGHYYNETLNIMDEPLSDKGKEDAGKLAAYFRDIPIKKIIVSQYKRTYETAAPAAEEKNIAAAIDARVNEINTGELRNMSEEEVAEKHPEVWEGLMSRTRDVRFPGGETGEEVKERQGSFLAEMQNEKEDILVVSHDGFIRLLMCSILGLPVWKRYKFKTDMGGISAVEYDEEDNEWKIIRFNQVL